jgi:hypothetical protein
MDAGFAQVTQDNPRDLTTARRTRHDAASSTKFLTLSG